MDVSQKTISIAVMIGEGKLDGIHYRKQGEHYPPVYPGGARYLHVTFEEGTWAACYTTC
jgi:hypothetical protein